VPKRGVYPLRFNKYIFISILSLFILVSTLYLAKNYLNPPLSEKKALFSWSSEVISQEKEELFTVMREAKLNTLFQSISTTEDINYEEFLNYAKKQKITVYALTGSPEWALDEDGDSMIKRVEYIAKINEHLPDDTKIKGIVMDVEPYLMEGFKENKEEIMKKFISAIAKTYKITKKYNMELVVCIPYFYDHWNLESEIEEIVINSDIIAIMNYYREKEIEHMEYEAALSRKHSKEIMTIYELQEPGLYGLTERNSYYGMSIEKVYESFEEIQSYFSKQKVSIAFHEYEYLKELLECQ